MRVGNVCWLGTGDWALLEFELANTIPWRPVYESIFTFPGDPVPGYAFPNASGRTYFELNDPTVPSVDVSKMV
jgi:hypothetical protein